MAKESTHTGTHKLLSLFQGFIFNSLYNEVRYHNPKMETSRYILFIIIVFTKWTKYRHCDMQIYAPSRHNDYGSTSFPGIDDAIENAKNLNTAESWHVVQHEVWRVARAVKHASLVLDGKLT